MHSKINNVLFISECSTVPALRFKSELFTINTMVSRLFIIVLLIVGNLSAQKPASFYSTTQKKFTAVLSDSALEAEPEIDHFEHLCPGYGGYELLHRSGDIRSWIDVRFGRITSDLYGETMSAAAGMFPIKENDVVEWRGMLKDRIFTPYAIIYRMTAQDPEDESKSFSRLVVVALKKGKAQVLGATTGADADAGAKKLADTVAPGK